VPVGANRERLQHVRGEIGTKYRIDRYACERENVLKSDWQGSACYRICHSSATTIMSLRLLQNGMPFVIACNVDFTVASWRVVSGFRTVETDHRKTAPPAPL